MKEKINPHTALDFSKINNDRTELLQKFKDHARFSFNFENHIPCIFNFYNTWSENRYANFMPL